MECSGVGATGTKVWYNIINIRRTDGSFLPICGERPCSDPISCAVAEEESWLFLALLKYLGEQP